MRAKKFRRLRLGKPLHLTGQLLNHEHPSIAPNGEHIAFYSGIYGSIGIYVVDCEGRFCREVSPHGGNNTQPFWHPDGSRIAFRHQHSIGAKWELWECELLGQPRALLADSRWNYKHPAYSPDGERLTYFTDEDGDGAYHIFIWDLESGERRQVTFGNTQMHSHPVFSPDGARICYHAYEGTDESRDPAVTNLYELDLASGAVEQLTFGEDQFKHPFYIDNETIVFHHEQNEDGTRGIEALHLPSRDIVILTDGSCNDKHPYPWVDEKRRIWLAWASKKLGTEPGDEHQYDIFVARLKGGRAKVKPKKG